MKWAFALKNKLKIACLFAVLTVLMLLANLLGRNNVATLDKTLTTLRNDRLLPAAFAHQINNLLYENKLMMVTNSHPGQIKANLIAIQQLQKQYESTYLTAEETANWLLFKTHLKGFLLTHAGKEYEAQRDFYFKQMQHSLNELVSIQVAESDRLMESGKKIVYTNVLLSNLITGLCLVFGLIALILLHFNFYTIHKPHQRHLLN